MIYQFLYQGPFHLKKVTNRAACHLYLSKWLTKSQKLSENLPEAGGRQIRMGGCRH
jgi:hypothetical protein